MSDDLGTNGARSMGNYHLPLSEPARERPPDWIDFRASAARAARRAGHGETVAVCGGCRTELDVDPVAHSPRCPGGPVVVEASTTAPTIDAATLLTALATAARELAELGATDPAIAVHFQNVCAAALEAIKETPADA